MGKRYTQRMWERLFRIALSGMNIGDFVDVNDSGERQALEYAIERLGAAPLVIFDVGANVGGYARLVLACLGERARLHCFEPSPATFQMLSDAVGSTQNVLRFNVGFSDQPAEVTLYSDAEGSGTASLYERRLYDHHARPLDRQETVRLLTMDAFCRDRDISHIHFLKMDVEGHELRVLHGARDLLRNSAIDFIQFEFGACNVDSRTYFRDFYRLLHDECGYQIFRIVKDGLVPVPDYHETREIFYMTNYLACSK